MYWQEAARGAPRQAGRRRLPALALDAVLGVSVRASFLDDPGARWLYYLFCLLCGGLCWVYPRRAALVGVGESAVNLTLLVLGVMVPILTLTETVASDPFAPLEAPVTMEGLVNFVLVGGMGYWSFQTRLRAASS